MLRVYSFNRVSRSLWFLINRMLKIPFGVFFDDFPMFSPEELSAGADTSVSELLDILGWNHARTGAKGKPFDSKFQVLGCSLVFAGIPDGCITLENKPCRVDRLCEQFELVKERGIMNFHQAQGLRGLLRYACGFFAGRYLLPVRSEVLSWGLPGPPRSEMDIKLLDLSVPTPWEF